MNTLPGGILGQCDLKAITSVLNYAAGTAHMYVLLVHMCTLFSCMYKFCKNLHLKSVTHRFICYPLHINETVLQEIVVTAPPPPPGFGDAALAPIDFPTAPVAAMTLLLLELT